MSAGGINNFGQPLVGAPPTVNGLAPTGSGQLAPVTAAGPVPAPAVVASPAMATTTAYVPVAGQQAGTVVSGGGLQDGSFGRTAAIATGVASGAQTRYSDAAAAAQTVAGQQVVDPSMVQGGAAQAAVGGAKGPAAWNEDWAKQFKDAGAPSEIIQQLTFTGAMGADQAQLQQMLDQIKGEIDTQLAKFAHDHPEAFKKLRSNPEVDRAMIAQIAAGVNAGQVPKEQLDQLVDSIGKSQGKMLFDMLVKPMLVYSLIPGWGAIRLAFAPFTGGKDILTGEKMFGDPMATTFTVLTAIGGGFTVYNNVRGAMNVAAGHAAIKAGGDAATIAAREGLENLSIGRKLWSYVPGTQLNQQMGVLGGLDDIKAGIANLKGMQQEVAISNYTKVVNGDVLMWRDSASKWTKMGYQPNSRGFIMGHIMGKKDAISIHTQGARPTILIDGANRGKQTAGHLGSLVDLVDDSKSVLKTPLGEVGANLKTRVFNGIDPMNVSAVKNLRQVFLGEAGKQLLDAGVIARPSGPMSILSKMRPNAVSDLLVASDNLAANTVGKAYGWQSLPKMGRWGIMGGLAAAGGYFMMIKPQMDAKKKAAEEAAKQQAGAAAGGQPAAGGAGALSADDQALLQQFAALPKDQQAQIIQQQYAQLQQASQTPNMTPDQQQQLAAAQAELQLLMQVANGQVPAAGAGAASGAATGGAAPAGIGAPGAAAPAGVGAPAAGGTPQFTAQGLGLAG